MRGLVAVWWPVLCCVRNELLIWKLQVAACIPLIPDLPARCRQKQGRMQGFLCTQGFAVLAMSGKHFMGLSKGQQASC